MIKIATWNVNSINKRLPLLSSWVSEVQPSILFLQELKCPFDKFPLFDLKFLGYESLFICQEKMHGAAILSKYPLKLITDKLPMLPQDKMQEARFIAAEVFFPQRKLTVGSVYVPAGGFNDINLLSLEEKRKFETKINFLRRLYKFLKETPLDILGGDFNIAPRLIDISDQTKQNFICCSPKERSIFEAFLDLGYANGYNEVKPYEKAYSWWSYQFGYQASNRGYRLDHILCRNNLFRYKDAEIDRKNTMGKTNSSDHAPVILTLDLV